MKKGIWTLILFATASLNLLANEVEMADNFRGEGKINIVIVVLSIVVLGLFSYLFYLDKKVSQKEKS